MIEPGIVGPDPYGIPEAIFGPLDPELPALIGRIAMLSAVVETKVDSLASSLSRQLQSQTAGKRPTDNLQTCRSALQVLAQDPRRELFAVTTGALIDEVEEALIARNTVVHRVWPKAGRGGWGGWKPTPKGQRNPDSIEWTDWKNFTRDDLVVDVTRLVRLVQQMSDALVAAG